jgi:ubiquitin carboxyl-terminal hydrolase 31
MLMCRYSLYLSQADLRKRNKINSRKYGTKGELTEQLALVLKALWTCKDPSEYSTSFKEVVERYGSQFRSSTQHDAQEFLFWLLDKVHEDLNTATKRKYKTIKNNYGRPDAVIAAETLANYMRCNNSFVQAVFRAQFRSSLTCPRCHKQSNTFDPFHCISVQLPQMSLQRVNVNVVYDVKTPKQVRMSLNVDQGSSVLALREQLHADTKIDAKRMILTECLSTGFGRLFCDSHPLSNVSGDDRVTCIEIPEKIEDSQVAICFINVHRNEEKSLTKRFGRNFNNFSLDFIINFILFIYFRFTVLYENKSRCFVC